MATETEGIDLGQAAKDFREKAGGWNSTAEQRESTRYAIRMTCNAIVPILEDVNRERGSLGAAAAGCIAYFAEIVPLLVEQIEQLEERIAALEGER